MRAAFSANIKERRDCSTALFDAVVRRMIIQAEHIPVHLGAMPEAVAAVAAHDPAPGEVWALNDPFAGGTHLPDITLVSRTELGYAVSRAHHADVGGIEPASLPAFSTDLYQEGLILPPTPLDERLVTLIAANSRNPDERRGDLRAQLAAQRADGGSRSSWRGGAENVSSGRWTSCTATPSGRCARALPPCPTAGTTHSDVIEAVDGDLEIRVAVSVTGDVVDIDFAGTASQHAGNLNCPLAVTRSACFFVVRVVTDPDIPASGGAFGPVTVRAPEESLVNARPPAAVVAGNTETSSRITDVVLAAFGQALDLPAQGAGTMSNVTLGTSEWTYYETVGGGQGASATADGRRRCTSRCRTPSTRPSRRSSSRTRCASSGTSCGSGRVAPGRDGAGTASCARSGRSSPAACRCSATGAAMPRRRDGR